MGRIGRRGAAIAPFARMSLKLFVSAAVMSAISAVPAEMEMPLRVSNVATGQSARVRLTNMGNQPVTAWSLAAISSSGRGAHREVYTVDGYLSEATHGIPGSTERLERLMPGESRDIPLDPLPDGATVDVIAAVLDDGTAIGDERSLSAIFAKRAQERDALKAVVDAFDAVLPATHGAEALSALRARFDALVQQNDAVPCRAALEAVQTYQRKSNAPEIDASLRTYADFVRREYDLAVRHAQRRSTTR
jgi:hypothetical protein